MKKQEIEFANIGHKVMQEEAKTLAGAHLYKRSNSRKVHRNR